MSRPAGPGPDSDGRPGRGTRAASDSDHRHDSDDFLSLSLPVAHWHWQSRWTLMQGVHRACSSRHNQETPPAAHTWATGRAPSASAGWGGRSRAAQRVLVPLRSRRSSCGTHMGHRARGPPPAPAGEGGRVARAAQRVLVPPRSRRAASGTHTGRKARPPRQRLLGRAVASRGRHSACSSRRDRDAPPAAHT